MILIAIWKKANHGSYSFPLDSFDLYFQTQSLGNDLLVCLPLVFLWRQVSPVSDKRESELLKNDSCV